jgi:hypothetical protein
MCAFLGAMVRINGEGGEGVHQQPYFLNPPLCASLQVASTTLSTVSRPKQSQQRGATRIDACISPFKSTNKQVQLRAVL